MNNYFSIAGLGIGVINLSLALLISFFGRNVLHRAWSYVNYSIALWGFSMFLIGMTANHGIALAGWKVFIVGLIPIAILYYHVIYIYCRLKSRRFLLFSYAQAAIFIPLTVFTDLMTGKKLVFFFHQFYYIKAGYLYSLFMVIWGIIVGKSFYELYKYILSSKGIVQTQAKYLFVAMLFGFGGGLNTAPAAWGFKVYPYGQVLVCVYSLLTTYAIFRYKLLDIRVVVTRVGVFFAVYSMVLGIPFWLGWRMLGMGKWLVPVVLMGISATVGPYIYLFMQRKAEDRLLKEQRRYQATLIQASSGMGRIKDIRKLLKLIVRIVTRAVRVEHSAVYVLNKEQHGYARGAALSSSRMAVVPEILPGDSALVEALTRNKGPVLVEEEQKKAEEQQIRGASVICSELAALHAALVVPSMIETRLVGFLVLGAKTSGKPFSMDDLSVFTILANQAALAIENALFYEDVKRTQEQLFKAEKMATIGTMADGLSHQINNRLHAMGFIAGDMQDTLDISSKKGIFSSPDLKKLEEEFAHALSRLQENVTRGGEIVQGLMKYTRRGEEGKSACDINKVFDTAYEMVQFKIKTGQMQVVKEYDTSAPVMVHGNFTQLQEVFFNLIDNAFDAMMQRKNELAEPGYQPTLAVSAQVDGNKVRIVFADNGIGVKEEDRSKLFTPFFTTKATAKKGTGLGLYVIRKIIEDNHGGRVDVDSQYLSGTKMILTVSTVKV